MAGPDDTTTPVPAIADVFDAEDARAEAADATKLAAKIREVGFEHYNETSSDVQLQRDEQARRAWANRQEAAAADMQVKREQATLERAEEHMNNWEAQARSGDTDAVTEYEHGRGLAEQARVRIDSAQARGAELRADADVADKEVARLEDEDTKAYDEFQYVSDQAERMEVRASADSSAGEALAKAEAAESGAADLRARGDVKGAEALEAQAKEFRASAAFSATGNDDLDVDDEKLEELGITVDDKFADADTKVGPIPDGLSPPEDQTSGDTVPAADGSTPAPDPTTPPTPPTTVIDMEPEIIEGKVPKVIDMEPEIIEGRVPSSTAPAATPPATTAADLRAEADLAIDTSAKVRDAIFTQDTKEYIDLSLQRDEQARQAWGVRQEAEAADMQVKREQGRLDEWQKELKDAEDRLATAGPTDSRLPYEDARTQVAVHQARVDSARKEADDLRQQAAAMDSQVTALDEQMQQERGQANELQTQADMFLVRAEELQADAAKLGTIENLEAQATTLRESGDEAGAAALDAQAAAQRATLNLDDNTQVDDERLAPLGVDIDDRFRDADDIVNLGYGEQPAAPSGEVMEMEPMIINPPDEGVKWIGPVPIDNAEQIEEIGPAHIEPTEIEPAQIEPAQIEMEPMIMEPPPEPAAQSDFQQDSFESDISDIAAVEQQLDQLTDLDG